MSYPGLTFALMVGVAIGTAIYYYFKNETPNQNYQYRNQDNRDYCAPPPTTPEGCDTLPTSTKRRRNSNVSQNCTICLDKLKASKTKRISCGHIFHENCITMWFRTSPTCPNCRAEQL